MKIPFWQVGLMFLVLACGCGAEQRASLKERWNPINDPLHLSSSYNRIFARLPVDGTIANAPWSDSYWPSRSGGIASRWRQAGSDSFQYTLYKESELRELSLRDLSKLSPAEKYDAYVGNFEFPLVAHERRRTSPNAESWEGICHGWAPASTNFNEPKAALLQGPSGIRIPFASSDIKALLSYYQGEIAWARSYSLGARCNIDLSENPEARLDPECRDTNAGSFHLVLTNEIGVSRSSFVADIQRDLQVWNQPIKSFRSTVLGEQGTLTGCSPRHS